MGRAKPLSSPPSIFEARGWVTPSEVAQQCVTSPCATGCFGGAWSLIDLYSAITDRLGECDVDIMTWIAAAGSFDQMALWLQSRRVQNLRLVIDGVAVQRTKASAALDLVKIEQQFGAESIRVVKTHAKTAVFRPLDGSAPLLVQTSANLNKNMRLESFFSVRDNVAGDYWRGVFDEIFEKIAPGLVNNGKQLLIDTKAICRLDNSSGPELDPVARIIQRS